MLNRVLGQVNLLEKGLDASWKKNEIIANNIANADTPGFKKSNVSFASIMSDEIINNENYRRTKSSNLRNEFNSQILNHPENSSFNSKNISDSSVVSASNQEVIATKSNDSSIRMDQNNVDIDYEMTELAKNAILYDSITYSVSKEIGRIKKVLQEG